MITALALFGVLFILQAIFLITKVTVIIEKLNELIEK